MKTKLLIATIALAATPALAQPAKTGTGSGSAATPAKTPATDAKKAPADKAADKAAAPAMPEMPKPPQELADAAKMEAGTWRCTGKAAMDPKNPTAMVDTKATITNKIDTNLGKWWMQTTMTAPMGKTTYKFVANTTYNAAEKKWYRFMIDNMGGAEMATSSGPSADKKTLVWEGDAMGQMTGMTHAKVKHTVDMSDPKAVKMKGEMSMDGKTWMTGYEATCKK
ncbi:MAG TPA: DUF1579 family protein [Kofleriaceae bacterium]|nr:DUF1579 family protein [Kofleriaceae bacterium]